MAARLTYQVWRAIEARRGLSVEARADSAFVELGVFEKNVKGSGHRRVQTASAIAKAAAQKIKVEKSPRRIGQHANRNESRGLVLRRGARAEAINRRDMIGHIAIAEMQNRILQPPDLSF